MKKILFFALILSAVTFASCKKTYVCTVNGFSSEEISSEDYTESEIDNLKAGCELVGGTWETR